METMLSNQLTQMHVYRFAMYLVSFHLTDIHIVPVSELVESIQQIRDEALKYIGDVK